MAIDRSPERHRRSGIPTTSDGCFANHRPTALM
jgi:hypothetical protein